jgi:hypothetical protein
MPTILAQSKELANSPSSVIGRQEAVPNEMGCEVSYPCLLSVSVPGPLMTQRHSVLPRGDVLFIFYSVCWFACAGLVTLITI